MPIQVKVLSAALTRNTQTVSNMDPYCLINVGLEYRRTTTKDEAGFNPVWNQTIFLITHDTSMRLQVFDQDLVIDDLIGYNTLDISNIYTNPNVPFKYALQLTYKKQKAGILNVQITYLSGNTQIIPQLGYVGLRPVPIPLPPNTVPLPKHVPQKTPLPKL